MKKLIIIIIIGLLWSCAPTRFVKPLEKDQKAVGFNFGGPMIKFGGLKIPIPYTSVYAGYGWKEKTTLHGGFHITAVAYKTLQFDFGITQSLLNQKGKIPGISVNGTVNLMTSLRDGATRIYPQLEANAYWEYSENKWMTYIGTSNWIDLNKNARKTPENHQYFLPNFHIGQSYRWKRMALSLEYKYLVPDNENQNSIVDFVVINNKGANGIYLSLKKTF